MARDDYPDVDFVDGAGDCSAPEEDLPQPAERDWAWLRRAKRPVVMAAAIAVVAAAAVELNSSRDSDPPPASAQPTHVARPADPSASFGSEIPVVLPAELPGDPAACLPGQSCLALADVPGAVLAAVRAVYPGARELSATTVLTHGDTPGSRLWFRQVNAQAGDLDILVRIQQPRAGDRLAAADVDTGDRSLRYVAMRSHGLTVLVQVNAPAGHPADPAKVRALARDRRLLVKS